MLLSLDAPWVALEQLEVLEGASSPCIERLQGLGHGGDASFTLASDTTSLDEDIDVEQAGVTRHSEWLEDAISLRWHVEVLDERLAVDHDASSARSHSDSGFGILALSIAPSSA